MIAPTRHLKREKNFYWKAIFDRGMALILLIPGIPLMLSLMFMIRLTSKGPALFTQIRTGKHGKPFTMYKLRSMHTNAEISGPVWAKTNDPRVTRLGRYLRKFHLDEIPQLYNVLRGEMSLVGPRPERPEFVEVLQKKVVNYTDRLKTLPGVTGLAQLNLPADTDLDSVKRKQTLDIEYIQKASLWLDLRIFLCTFGRLVKFPERILLRLFGLRRMADNAPLPSNHIWNLPHELMVAEHISYPRAFSAEGEKKTH
jgi:lipopolysaccharide/colanic/teichoic acid biosynthesis glycosyltransferase